MDLMDAMLNRSRLGHGILAILVGIATSLITWGLASAFTQVGERPTLAMEITLYIVAGGVWAFLILWAIRPR